MQRRRMLRGVRTRSLRPIISRLAYLRYENRFQIPCNRSLFRGSANFGFRDECAVDSPAALVRGAWSANKHVPAILAGAKPPVNSDDGLPHHGWSIRGALLRHRMRRGVASHARGGRLADK